MNQLDIVILAVLGIGAIYGLARGMLRMITSVVSLIAAIYCASIYYPIGAHAVERTFGASTTVATALGYIIAFAVIFVLVEFAGGIVARVIYTVHLGWLDTLAGAVVGAGMTGAVLGLMLMFLT